MKAVELRNKSIKELKTVLSGLQRQQFKLRLVKASGEFVKTHEVRKTRRNIARVMTMIAEEGKKT